MRFIFIVLFLLINVRTFAQTDSLKTYLSGTWFHSFEEDNHNKKIYRKQDFNFPPSRGRNSFIFEKDGKVKILVINAYDGIDITEANWKLRCKKKIHIYGKHRMTLAIQNSISNSFSLISVKQ